MLRYYLALGFRSLRRNPVLTALMVLTLSIGVAASMTTLTLLHGMSGDPIPGKSGVLFVPRLDNGPGDNPDANGEPPEQISHRDAMALWEQAKGKHQTPIYGISPAIDSGRPDLPPFFGEGVAVGRDFFTMFEVPFLHGQAWSVEEDGRGAAVVVLGRAMAERIFGAGENPVGRTLRLSDHEYTIIGVVDTWNPVPKFYRLIGSNQYGESEDVFLPFRTAVANELAVSGSVNCSSFAEPGFKGQVASECVWIQYWVELDSANQRAEYADYLVAYVTEQKALGRFTRPINNRLHDVMEWLDERGVVSDDTRTSTWLAFGFLLVCLVNTVGLLLAKFSSRPGEIGVRRALGATRRDVFSQYLTEAGVIGLVGAGVGVGLTFAALAVIRSFDKRIALITQMDGTLLLLAVVLSVVASLVAGLLPTWRACQVVPALQLKSQ